MSNSKYRIRREFQAGAAPPAGRVARPAPVARSEGVRKVKVGEDGEGQRLDNYLVKLLKGVPKSHVYRIVRSGEVRVNGSRASPDSRVHEGDELRLPPLRATI